MTHESSAEMAQNSFSVLVVDDEARLRADLVAALEEEGIEVAGEAVDGQDAVVLAATMRADVLVMDLRMPNMNGIEAARHISQQVDPPEIVLLSAYDDPALRDAAAEAGIFDYVLKGCRVEFLAGVIYAAARKARARRELRLTN